MTLSEACCYGAESMPGKARKYLLVILAVAALGYLFYKFRNSITLEGFRWSMVWDALRDARPGLLFLAIAAIYVCYALRALRWMHFSRTLGRLHFWNVFTATVMGFACVFLLGRAGEPIRPVLIAKKDSLSVPRMFGVYVLERVFDIGATAVIAVLALLMFSSRGLGTDENAHMMAIARSAGAMLLAMLVSVIAFLVYFRYHGAT